MLTHMLQFAAALLQRWYRFFYSGGLTIDTACLPWTLYCSCLMAIA